MYVKKFLMSVGTFSTVALPVASAVSCGEEETKDTSGSDQSSGTEQITTAEVDDSVVKLSIDLTEINTPEELINKILEASNMQYSENFLEILAVDDPESPTKLTEESRQAFIDYYANIKPIEITITDGTNPDVIVKLDLTTEAKTISSELENNVWVDDYDAASGKISSDAMSFLMTPDSTVPSPNISAYIGFLSVDVGYEMLPMRVVSDNAWNAYMGELEKIHDFIWTIVSSDAYIFWNNSKDYILLDDKNPLNYEVEKDSIEPMNVKSGEYFDNPLWVDPSQWIGTYLGPYPSKLEESSNLEAAFAIAMLNLFDPID